MKKLLFAVLLGLVIIGCSKKVEEPKKDEVKQEETVKEEVKEETVESTINDAVAEDTENVAEQKLEDDNPEVIVDEDAITDEDEVTFNGSDLIKNLKKVVVTDEIVDRNPGDEVTKFKLNERAYLYSEFVDIGNEKTVTHQWLHVSEDGTNKEIYSKDLTIKGSRWRTWTSKELHLKGEWKIFIRDADGKAINLQSIIVE